MDQKSSDFAVGSSPVTRIHALASGVDPLHSLRSTRFVEDFGGDVPTRVDEVGVRLDELERLVVTLSRTKPLCDRVKATLLAHVFSSIIRIHPFQDGNGRVARFTVLYLITCWEVDPFLIPKVRNSRAWKSALASAVEGDTQDLTHVFLAELVSHNNKVEGNE